MHNAYVAAAERRLQDEAEARVSEAREQKLAEHETELAKAREQAAADVVGRLTAALFSDDSQARASAHA